MTEWTHQCSACLRKTIQNAVEVAPPLVLAHSTCHSSGGRHTWARRTTAGQQAGYEHRCDWKSSVYFLFVEIPIDWKAFSVAQLKGVLRTNGVPFTAKSNKQQLIALCVANILPRSLKLEISGTAFAITPRRFICCHHSIFDERSLTTFPSVVICSRIIKEGDQIIPDPTCQPLYGDLHVFDANLDFAIFNVRGMENLTPIPICPEESLPSEQTTGAISVFYCAIGFFQACKFGCLHVWRQGPYSILQYGENANEPPSCRMLLEHGLCRGSSGGALVTADGQVVAMHLASLSQGRYVWRHVRGSSLAHSVGESITDGQQIYEAYKEGLVLCRVSAIMNAVNNP